MDEMKKFRLVLFWIIATFFAAITLLTILSVFFGVGQLNPEFQSKAFYAFIIEIAAALFALFYAAFGLKKEGSKVIEPMKPGEALPALKDVGASEIETVAATKSNELYTGPDRSYLINLPPSSWTIKEDTMHNFQIEALSLKNPVLIDQVKQSSEDFQDVVSFEEDKDYWFIPKPGQTIINESLLLTAKDFHFSNQLMIVPMERYRPPLYLLASAEKILLEFVQYSKLLGVTDVKKINSGTLKGTARKIVEVEAVQTLQNIIVNENEFAAVEIHHHFFAIEGEKKNYIIRASYLTGLADDKQTSEENKKILFDLLNSFKPLRVPELAKEKEQEKATVYEKQKNINEKYGDQVFMSELGLFFFGITDANLENKDELKKVIKALTQFKAFASQVKLDQQMDADLKPIWTALDTAKNGSTEDLKKELNEALKKINAALAQKAIEQTQQDALPENTLVET